MNSYDRLVLGLRVEEAEVVGALITPPVMVQTLSCLAPLKQNLSVKTGRVIGHWQEKMIERADISLTGGDAQEEEGEVFQGVEVVLDQVVASSPSVLCSKIQTAIHTAYLIIQNLMRLHTLMPVNLITVLTVVGGLVDEGLTKMLF